MTALTRIRVDLAARGYDVVVGAGAVAELASVRHDRRRCALVTQAAIPAAIVDGATAIKVMGRKLVIQYL